MSISRVQYKHGYPSAAVTLDSNVTVGNVIVVAASNADATLIVCTDNLGNVYTLQQFDHVAGRHASTAVFVAPVTTGGSCTITCVFTGGSDAGVTAAEYSGVSTTVDDGPYVRDKNAGDAASIDFTLTTTGMIFFANANETGTIITSLVNVTAFQTDTGHLDLQADSLNVASGSVTVSWSTWTQTDQNVISLVLQAAASGYTLLVSSGTYSISGSTITMRASRLLSAGSGSFTVTGTDVTLRRTYRFDCGSGTFTVTGTDASIRCSRLMSVDSGTFSITGTDIGLFRNYTFYTDPGSVIVTGSDVDIIASRILATDSGTFTINGQDIEMYTIVPSEGLDHPTNDEGHLKHIQHLGSKHGIF